MIARVIGGTGGVPIAGPQRRFPFGNGGHTSLCVALCEACAGEQGPAVSIASIEGGVTMDKQGFPARDTLKDVELLRAWWCEEMAKCGLSGTVAVQHEPYRSPPPRSGTGPERLMEFVTGSAQVVEANLYRAGLPGAPWPLEALVVTASNGCITTVTFRANLKMHLALGDILITKSLGWVGEKLEVAGPGASLFSERKDVLKICKADLSLRYEPPLRGFHASTKTFEMRAASVALTSGSGGGTEASIRTTVRDEAAFVGRKYSLGLDRALRIFGAIEKVS